MAVSIPVSADASSVLRSLSDIQAALRRVGAEARDLGSLDLSHPELRAMSADLEKVGRQFEDMRTKVRGATGASVRSIVGDGPESGGLSGFLKWANGASSHFATDAERQRHFAAVGNYVFQGTGFAPQAQPGGPPPPAPPSPPPAPPAPPPNSPAAPPGMIQSLLKSPVFAAVKGGVAFGAGMAGIQGIGSMIVGGVRRAQDESVANDVLLRHRPDDEGMGFGALRDAVRKTADSFWLTYEQAQRISLSWTRLADEATSHDEGWLGMSGGTRLAAGVARSYGIAPEATTQSFARGTMLGISPERFAEVLVQATSMGRMGGRSEEVMQSLLRWSEGQTRTLSFQGAHMEEFAGLLTTMNQGNVPGVRGGGGEAILGAANSAIAGGGGAGMAGLSFIYRAFAAHGLTDPYKAQMQMEGGLFERIGEKGPTNFEAIMEQIDRAYPNASPEMRWQGMGRLMGLNMHQAAVLDDARHRGGVNFGKLSDMGVDLRSVDSSSLRDLGVVMNENRSELETRVERMRKTGTDADRVALSDITAGSGTEDIRKIVARVVGSHGMANNEGTEVTRTLNNMTNAITGASTGFVPAMNALREQIVDAVGSLQTLSEMIANSLDKLSPATVDGNTSRGTASVAIGAASRAYQAVRSYVLGDSGAPASADGIYRPPAEIEAKIRAEAARQGVDPDLAVDIARTEGGPGRSPKGAVGYMQVTKDAADQYGPTLNRENVDDNITLGVRELADDMKWSGGNKLAAAAAYNAGQHGRGVPRYRDMGGAGMMPNETQGYVAKMKALQEERERGHPAPVAAPSGGTPLPAGHRDSGSGGSNVNLSIDPVRVVHENGDGSYRGEGGYLTVRPSTSPASFGLTPQTN